MSRRKNLVLAVALCLLPVVPAGATDVEAVSVPAPGMPSDTAGSGSFSGSASADGRYVVYESSADNVVAGQLDGNRVPDVFLHDRIAGTTVLVSHRDGDPERAANDRSWSPTISANGGYVAFLSYATDLIADQVDATLTVDLFLYDRAAGTTKLVTHVAGLPTETDGEHVMSVGMSADGSQLVFVGSGANFVEGQVDGLTFDVFLYDRATGTNTLVSHTSSSPVTAAGSGTETVVSADGLWVAFVSASGDLVAGQSPTSFHGYVFLYSRATGTNVLVSHVSSSSTTTPLASSSSPAISADGSRVAYASQATDLVAGQADSNAAQDVFLYDRATGTSSLVSRATSSATTAANGISDDPAINADGRYVAFASTASDLVTGVADASGLQDVFLHDRVTGTSSLVSHAAGGALIPANGASSAPALSADGSFVAFLSKATNGVSGQVDGNESNDVFLYDRAAGSLELVSHAAGSATTAGNRISGPSLSVAPDGAWIAYDSLADDLTEALDGNVGSDVLLYDRSAGTSDLASLRAGTASATAPGAISFWPASSMSNDGRYVAFESAAPNLVAGQTDANGSEDVFLRDRLTGETFLVSHGHGGAFQSGTGASFEAAASADGSSVVFASRATDLIPGQVTNSPINLFHWNRSSGTVTLVNRSAASPMATGNAGLPDLSSHEMSGDGRWIAYSSLDTDLVAGQTDLNSNLDVFLFDRATGTTTLASRSAASPAQAGDGSSAFPAISNDGRWIAFRSGASDLVPGQTGAGGIFLYDRTTGTTVRVSPEGWDVEISGDGRWVAFESTAPDLVPGQVDTNSQTDIFLWDRVSGTTVLASRSASSPVTAANSDSTFGSDSQTADVLSTDGRYLVFASYATDLVIGQTESNQQRDVFLFDRVTGSVTLVSRCGSPELTANSESFGPSISADGSKVAFVSRASDLVPSQYDPWGDTDVFLYDPAAGTLALASHKPFLSFHAGDFSSGTSFNARISADGQVVAFSSADESLTFSDLDGHTGAFIHADPLPGRDFFTATPCRVLDTRQQGPALASGVERTFAVEGLCGIPATARAVVVNVTAVQPTGAGHVVLHPGDLAAPLTSTINFTAGATRANNAILALAFDGTGTLAATPVVAGGGTVHLILDVSGWFE
jgi:Tol biopolymer transport system component